MKYQKSQISSHHNYLVNNILTTGIIVGDPRSGFFFLADVVLLGESTPRISARLMNEKGLLLLELDWNRIQENPGGCSYQSIPGGFRISQPSDEPIVEVQTQAFTNGYLTRIKGRMFDENGILRMESLGESIRVHGEAQLVLESPYSFHF